jgi:hypothetical protein
VRRRLLKGIVTAMQLSRRHVVRLALPVLLLWRRVHVKRLRRRPRGLPMGRPAVSTVRASHVCRRSHSLL